MNIHEKYINRCIQLAKNGEGLTSPNPMVGAVIVHNNKIIGEGWHRKAGSPHAEVHAINNVKDKELLKQATIYVSLEPCSHFGRTPPCSQLIVKHKIPNVVIGTIDPNAKVYGQGISYLKSNGCDVTVGVLEEKCIHLNRRFFTFHQHTRPYIILKWAASGDGFIDVKRAPEAVKGVNWISNVYARQLAHKLRAREDSILVGTNTVINDNPSLTLRNWKGNGLLRMALDRKSKISNLHAIKDKSTPTLVFIEDSKESDGHKLLEYEELNFNEPVLPQICALLHSRNVQSLIVEGGAQLINSFIDSNLWDEAHEIIGTSTFSEGLKAPEIHGEPRLSTRVSNDIYNVYYNN